MTKEEIDETRVLFIGAWDVLGRRAPKLFDEIVRLTAQLEDHKAKASSVWSDLNTRLNAALLRTDEQQVRADKAEAREKTLIEQADLHAGDYEKKINSLNRDLGEAREQANDLRVRLSEMTFDRDHAHQSRDETRAQVAAVLARVAQIQAHIEAGPAHPELTAATIICSELLEPVRAAANAAFNKEGA